MWLSLGHFKTSSWHTHTRIYIFLPPYPFYICQSLCFLFPSFSISVSVSLSLSLSLQLLSSPVQCSVSESLKCIPDHFLWHTQQKPVCQLQHWQDEAKRPPKLCGCTWAYASLSCTFAWMCWFALLKVWVWGSSLRSSPSLNSQV